MKSNSACSLNACVTTRSSCSIHRGMSSVGRRGRSRSRAWPEEAVGSHYSVFFTPQEVAAGVPQAHLDRACDAGKIWAEGWRVRMDGTRFWAEALTVALRESDGTLKGFAKIVRDATERHESLLALQQAAKDSDAQSHAILDTAVDAIITIDARGRIETINRAGIGIFGYQPDEVVGRNVSMLMPQPFRGEHDRYLANYLKTGKARIIGIGREVVALKKDGTRFPIELSVSEVDLGGAALSPESRPTSATASGLKGRFSRLASRATPIGRPRWTLPAAHGYRAARPRSSAEAGAEGKARGAGCREGHRSAQRGDFTARSLSHGLYPVSPQPHGLSTALQELAASVSSQFRIKCTFTCSDEPMMLDNSGATHLYRIAQEAIQNAIRHGKASRVDMACSPICAVSA